MVAYQRVTLFSDMSSRKPARPYTSGEAVQRVGFSKKYPGFEVSGAAGRRLLWKHFPTPIGSSHLIVQRECASVCEPLIPKIQFNGIGGLLTYISVTPNADVSASGSYGEVCIAPPPPPTCIAPPLRATAKAAVATVNPRRRVTT
jgi:hypothetical protein